MVVVCPACRSPIGCADDASCVESVPTHSISNGLRSVVCTGSGELGFVLQFGIDPRPDGWTPEIPQPDPRYRRKA